MWQDQWYSINHDEIMDKLNPDKWLQTIQTILKTSKYISHILAIEKKNVVVH